MDEKIDEIYRILEEKGVQVPYEKDELKATLTGLDQSSLNKVKSCLEGIVKSIGKLTSDDPAQQMSGVLDIVATVTVFIPGIGPVVSGVCSLISNVIIAFGRKSNGTNMTTAFESVLERVLGEYHDDDVKAECSGVKFRLENMQTYLDGYTKTPPRTYTQQNVEDLASHDVEYTTVGTECLGKLEYYIKQYSINKKSGDEDAIERQARHAIDYIEVYLELSSIRKLLLSVYYCILLTATTTQQFEATKSGLLSTLKLASEKDKEIAKIVPVEFTKPDLAVLASIFKLPEHPVIRAFHQTANPVIQLDGRIVQIKPKISPTYHLITYEDSGGAFGDEHDSLGLSRYNVAVSSSEQYDNKNNSCFTLRKVGGDNGDNIYVCKGKYTHVKAHSPNQRKNIERYNWMKLIRLTEVNPEPDEQLYLMASVNCPTRFLYHVNDKRPETTVGDPGERGYWYLDQASAEIARSRDEGSCSMI